MRAAWIYAGLTAVVSAFHLSLILGAPLGHLTMGGTWQGALPGEGRVASALAMVLLAAMALVVLARARVLRLAVPTFAIWAVVGMLAIGVVQHVATPSAAERALWLPLILVMLVCALVVARQRPGT